MNTRSNKTGGQVVGGSNPLVPTSNTNGLTLYELIRFLRYAPAVHRLVPPLVTLDCMCT